MCPGGLIDGFLIDVGGKKLDREDVLEIHSIQSFLHHDGQRVGFLAGGTSGSPDSQRAALRPGLQQLGYGLFLEKLEQARIAEEVGHAN